jgi:hypothetical protein
MSLITSFDLQSIEARLEQNRRRGPAAMAATEPLEKLPCEELAMGVAKERDLHEDILAFCRGRGWIALHSSMAEATHRNLGEWDFVIVADSGRVFLVECKTAKGKLTPEQAGMKAWAEKLGHKPVVVRSFNDFMEVVK